MRVAALCTCLAVWLPITAAEGADFHCAAGDVACLIQAIRDANANGEANTIRLEAGTYSLMTSDHSGFGGDTGLPAIAGSVAIVGAGADQTIIQRSIVGSSFPRFRLFEVAQTGTLDLEHLTLTRGGGGIETGGAAVYSLGSLRIRNASIRDNFAGAGGAILAPSADVSVSDSLFSSNSDMAFGVIVIGCFGFGPCPPSTATATITRSSFSRNLGVAIIRIESGAAADIRDSDFIANTGDGNAAILVLSQRPVTITNTTIVGHAGRAGGSIRGFGNPDVLVTNSTLINNKGGVGGVRIQNSIVWGNDRTVDSNGDCLKPGGSWLPVISLGHNLFENSTWCGAVQSDLTGDPGFDLTGVSFVTCGIFCEAPFLDTGRSGGRYLRLRPDSLAVDAGSTAACPATDQQGLARPIDGTGAGIRACDIGATEYYPVVNDRLQLEGLKYSFVKPSSLGFVDPRASAGAFRITATFRNVGPDLCHVAFKVPVLNGPTGTNPVLLTPARELLGGQHTAVAAGKTGAPPHLVSGGSATYHFTIGVQQRASINFLVDALGDATSGQCNQ
jgi:hypothetical protein